MLHRARISLGVVGLDEVDPVAQRDLLLLLREDEARSFVEHRQRPVAGEVEGGAKNVFRKGPHAPVFIVAQEAAIDVRAPWPVSWK